MSVSDVVMLSAGLTLNSFTFVFGVLIGMSLMRQVGK